VAGRIFAPIAGTQRQCSSHDQNRKCDRRQDLDRRKIQSVNGDGFELGVEVLPIQLVEPSGFPLLLAEQLHDSHARQPLLHESINAGNANADIAIGLAHSFAKQSGDQNDERNDGE
jgi:hypothetical protein